MDGYPRGIVSHQVLGTPWRRQSGTSRASAVEVAPSGGPTADVLYGPMIDARFPELFEGWLKLIQPHHTVHGSTGTGRITAANPRAGFVGNDPGVLDQFTRWQAMNWDYSGRLQKAQMDVVEIAADPSFRLDPGSA